MSEFFCSVAFDGGNLVFEADAAGSGRFNIGVFAFYEGELLTVVEPGDTLDGKIVDQVGLNGDRSFDGNHVVFRVIFEDGSTAIYLATL